MQKICFYFIRQGGPMSRKNTVVSEQRLNGAGDGKMAEDTREELLTVREVARRLRVDDTTVRRWIKSGALEAITLPHRGKRQAYRIKRSTLDTLLNSALPLI
jgi:excisionase family DNA binding protein